MKDYIETRLLVQCWCTWSMGIDVALGMLLEVLLTDINPNSGMVIGIVLLFVLSIAKGIWDISTRRDRKDYGIYGRIICWLILAVAVAIGVFVCTLSLIGVIIVIAVTIIQALGFWVIYQRYSIYRFLKRKLSWKK